MLFLETVQTKVDKSVLVIYTFCFHNSPTAFWGRFYQLTGTPSPADLFVLQADPILNESVAKMMLGGVRLP